jgi:hypothetical protein
LSLDRPKKVFFFYRQNYKKIGYPSNFSARKIKTLGVSFWECVRFTFSLSLDCPKKVFFFYRQNYEKIDTPLIFLAEKSNLILKGVLAAFLLVNLARALW